MQSFGQSTMRSDTYGLVLGGVFDPVRLLVPVGLAKAKPVHLASGGTVTLQVRKGAFRITVLPRVDAVCLRMLQQFDYSLGRMPGGLILTQNIVKVRIPVDGVATNNQTRYFVRP